MMNTEDLSIPKFHQLGYDQGRGNLLGIEPYMIPQDYASKETLFAKLNSYMVAAQHKGWLNEKTIVLFPEYIGTWIVLANASKKVLQAATIKAAERMMVFRHPLNFLTYFLKSPEKGRAQAAFFRMKSNQMVAIYQDVFSHLAREYAVTVIAGSIVLPAPQISNRGLLTNDGPLHNISIVFQPDGTPSSSIIHKAFPTFRELLFTAPGSPTNIPTFETPASRLGVLICADSWFPQAYIPLQEQGIDLLAVPSYDISGMQNWNKPWLGYDGWPAPADVRKGDIKNITEAQAWEKYSLAGRIRSSGARYGMNVFMRGKLWDQDLGGWPATLVRETETFVEEQTRKSAVLSVWR